MDRRDFIKHSAAAVAGTSVILSACRNGKPNDPYGEADRSTAGRLEMANDLTANGMTLRTNPNTGDKVSLLGFGMMRLPVQAGGSARDNQDSPIDQEAVNEMVDYALEHGVNLFDTSPVYCQGLSEQSTGIALSRHPRNSYFISTKLSNFSSDTWSLAESKAMFEHSLQELQTDYVDYLLMHGLGMRSGGMSVMETFHKRYIENGLLDWLVGQKAQGRIRNLGFSFHGSPEDLNAILALHDVGRYHWDCALIQLNYLDWRHAKEINKRNSNAELLYAELEKRGIPVLVMEPLLGGRLANQPDAIAHRMREKDSRFSPAAWAFRFAGSPSGVLSVLSGMSYMEHLRENIRTYSPLVPLTSDEEEWILGLAKDIFELKAIPCTTCNYCMPCPYGLNIPAIFAHYNKSVAAGTISSADKGSEFQRNRRAFLVGYDRAVPSIRQADHCIGCDRCIRLCPQHIDIPHEMVRINRLVEKLKQTL